jgi:predicted enzyme related to lactoylglutathione lyase
MTVRYLVDDVAVTLPFEAADLCATLVKAIAAGGKPCSEPIKGPGGRQVLIDDPSSNPIELFEAREG